jgi:hypothetical protein
VHTSSYTTDLGYITLETKSVVVQYITVGHGIVSNNEIHLTGKYGFDKTDILRLGP